MYILKKTIDAPGTTFKTIKEAVTCANKMYFGTSYIIEHVPTKQAVEFTAPPYGITRDEVLALKNRMKICGITATQIAQELGISNSVLSWALGHHAGLPKHFKIYKHIFRRVQEAEAEIFNS